MDDRCLDGLSHICAVKTSPCFCWGCSETDLVVSYDMDDSVYVVMVQVGHLEAFINDSLAGNCSITVNQHSQTFFLILQCILNSLNMTHDDWIHSLQMRRIRQDSQTNILPLNIALSCHTEMILDIPRVAPWDFLVHILLELCEDLLHGLVEDIGKCVQPTPVGHSKADILYSCLDCLMHEFICIFGSFT